MAVENHARLPERSVKELHSQKTSHADIVQGTCLGVIKEISAKISSIPQASLSWVETRNGLGITKVFNDCMDKKGRKSNLYIHNLPEVDGGSRRGQIATWHQIISGSDERNLLDECCCHQVLQGGQVGEESRQAPGHCSWGSRGKTGHTQVGSTVSFIQEVE